MTSGLYKITNLVNGHFYIGSSTNVERRFKQHRRKLNIRKHANPRLRNAWNKYGEQSFTFAILMEVENKEGWLMLEQDLIDEHFGQPYFYNVSRETETGPGMKNHKHTEKTKQKLSVAHKGQVPWNKGKKHTEEAKKRMSRAHKGKNTWSKGRKHTEEAKKKMSNTRLGKNNPFYGKQHTEETKRKISETRRRLA